MSDQTDLNVILDGIEHGTKRSGRSHLECIADLEKDKAVLVKALRRAMDYVRADLHRARQQMVVEDLFAILQPSSDPSGTDSSSVTSVSSPKDSSPSPSSPVIEGEKWHVRDNVVYSPGGQKEFQLYWIEVAHDLVEEINASLERVMKAQKDLDK